MTLTSGAAVLSLGRPLLLRLLIPLLFYLAAVGMGVMSLLSVGSFAGTPPRVFWRAVRRAPRRRELYLFSDSDLLCDADKVAELIDERRRLDPEVPIEMVRWNVSRHCTHLVDRREEYERTLRRFCAPDERRGRGDIVRLRAWHPSLLQLASINTNGPILFDVSRLDVLVRAAKDARDGVVAVPKQSRSTRRRPGESPSRRTRLHQPQRFRGRE